MYREFEFRLGCLAGGLGFVGPICCEGYVARISISIVCNSSNVQALILFKSPNFLVRGRRRSSVEMTRHALRDERCFRDFSGAGRCRSG